MKDDPRSCLDIRFLAKHQQDNLLLCKLQKFGWREWNRMTTIYVIFEFLSPSIFDRLPVQSFQLRLGSFGHKKLSIFPSRYVDLKLIRYRYTAVLVLTPDARKSTHFGPRKSFEIFNKLKLTQQRNRALPNQYIIVPQHRRINFGEMPFEILHGLAQQMLSKCPISYFYYCSIQIISRLPHVLIRSTDHLKYVVKIFLIFKHNHNTSIQELTENTEFETL